MVKRPVKAPGRLRSENTPRSIPGPDIGEDGIVIPCLRVRQPTIRPVFVQGSTGRHVRIEVGGIGWWDRGIGRPFVDRPGSSDRLPHGPGRPRGGFAIIGPLPRGAGRHE